MDRLSLGQPVLDHALHIIAQDMPQASVRTTTALKHFLQGMHQSAWPEVAWQSSYLTGDGFPVEFSFTTADTSVRYTTEVSGPEIAPEQRLLLAQQQLADLGAPQLPTEIGTCLRRIQATGQLSYGTWVGGRHTDTCDRYKLYVEVPSTLTSSELRKIAPDWVGNNFLPHRDPSLRMVGYDLTSARTELYYRVVELQNWEIQRLLYQLKLEDQTTAWQQFLTRLCKPSRSLTLPGSNVGFSLSFPNQGTPTVSLFSFARSVFGSDRNSHQQLLQLAEEYGWDLTTYARLSRFLAHHTGCNTAHGMVSIVIAPTIAPKASPILGIGLCPPEKNHATD